MVIITVKVFRQDKLWHNSACPWRSFRITWERESVPEYLWVPDILVLFGRFVYEAHIFQDYSVTSLFGLSHHSNAWRSPRGRKFANNNLRVCALLYTHLHHKLTSAQRKHFIELLTYHIIVLCLGTVYGHSFYFSFAGHGRTFDIWCVCWWPKLAQSHLHPTSMASRKAMMKKDDLVGQILGKTMRKRAKTLTSTMGTALKKPFTGQKMGHYIVYLQSKDTNIKHP